MRKALFFLIILVSALHSRAQFETQWNFLPSGNTGTLDIHDTRGFVSIFSSQETVGGEAPQGIIYKDISDFNTPGLYDISSIPLSKRYKARAGVPFTIDVHTSIWEPEDPRTGVGTFNDHSTITDFGYVTGQNESATTHGLEKYSTLKFEQWDPSVTRFQRGNRITHTFPVGRTEGWVAIRIYERNDNTLPTTGQQEYHYTIIVLPFVVEGPFVDLSSTAIPPLGSFKEPSIPQLILHNPPGNKSTVTFQTNQEVCRNMSESLANESSNNGNINVTLGIAGEAGLIVTTEFEFSATVSASIGAGQSGMKSSGQQDCVAALNSITTSPGIAPANDGSIYIGYSSDIAYGVYPNVRIENTSPASVVKDSSLIFGRVPGTASSFYYSKADILNDIQSNQNILNSFINSPDSSKLKHQAQSQIDIWRQVLEKDSSNIANPANEVLENTFQLNGVLDNSKTVSISTTDTYEVSHFLEAGIGASFVVNVGGSGVSGGYEFKTKKTLGQSVSNTNNSSTTVSYHLEDDSSGDIHNIKIVKDPTYGTPIFLLNQATSKTSCPFEGGYQRDQPKLQFRDPFSITQKSATISDVSLGQPAQFPITLRNLSNESRTYFVRVRPNSIIDDNFEVLAIGNSNLTTNAVPVSVPAGDSINTNITITRPQPSLPTQVSGVIIEWYTECEPDIKDSLVINASWATPPPPVLGALPDPNPERNIYVCGVVPPIPLNASCSGGTKPYWYKSATGGLPLDPIETNSITDPNAADGDEYFVSCQSSNYISPRSFYGKVTLQTSPVLITESGPLSFCGPGSVTFNSYADNNNKALNFVKASSQYVEVPHSSSLNLSTTFTFEAWVNYSGINAAIIDKGNYDFLWMINANGNANKLGYYDRNTGWKYSIDAVPENTWTHVAITLQGGTLSFYINGVESGNAILSSAFQDNLPMNIGRQQPSYCQCNHFNGSMDELRLWNVAKSQAEIQASMKTGVAHNSAGLVAYYKFNEASATSVIDATSNNNNGVLMNGASRQTAITVPFNELNVSWAPLNTTASSFTATTSGTYTASVNYGIGCSTSVNKTVSVGSNAALVSLSSPNDDIASTIITKTASSSNGKIVATNKVTGTARVNYQAKSLELNAGFIAESGTVFSAEIGGCPD
ncbi:MAG: LamG domain-containing protein [Cytophagales bacterium]|nr:LamG domain-containing protein [Cytophagales bacterium]